MRFVAAAESKRQSVADLVDRYIAEVLPQKKEPPNPKRQIIWCGNIVEVHAALSARCLNVHAEQTGEHFRQPEAMFQDLVAFARQGFEG